MTSRSSAARVVAVLPGLYASITQRGLHMVCFGLHPADEPAYVEGTYGADTKVETKPAR